MIRVVVRTWRLMCLNFIGPSIEAQDHVGALYSFGFWVLGNNAFHNSDRGKVWSIHRPAQYRPSVTEAICEASPCKAINPHSLLHGQVSAAWSFRQAHNICVFPNINKRGDRVRS
jgi:hypothetical protein